MAKSTKSEISRARRMVRDPGGDKRMISIDFKFERLSDSVAFDKWRAEHPEADVEQMIAHAKANGCIGATLGDGTEWDFGEKAE